jgi:phage-related minor tail protein
MPQRIKGITVEIGGDTVGLQKALSDVNSRSRDVQKELRDIDRLLKFDPENVEALAQKQKLLNEQVENTSDKLKQLRDVEKQVEKQFNLGDISEKQFRAFRREIEFTERELQNLKGKMDIGNVDTSRARKSLRKLKDAASEVKDELDTVKTGFAGLGAGAAAGVGAVVAGSEELNRSLARLNFNAVNEGFDAEAIEADFKKVATVSGETDSAVETLANMMQTGFDQEQLSQAIDHINGAAIKFSDTLKTEGIADGLQETFATGKAMGQFGELLERSGVNLDTFNDKLAAAKKNGEETDFVLQTLSDLGLASSAEGFKEMNSELVKQQEAQLELQMALADLALVFAPIVAAIADIVTKLIEWMEANPALTVTLVAITTAIAAVIGVCMALAPIISLCTAVAGALSRSCLPMAGIVLGIVAAFAALVAAGIYLYKNWDEVKAKAAALAKSISQAFSRFKEAVADKMTETWNSIKRIWGNVMDFFRNIDLKQMGRDIIQGLINGISSMARRVADAARNIANGIGDKIKGILKLGSPSKLLESYGEDTGEGLAIGIEDSLKRIQGASKEMAKAAVPTIRMEQPEQQPAALTAAKGQNMTVNIHSPKALDAREANLIWSRTMKKMQLQW